MARYLLVLSVVIIHSLGMQASAQEIDQERSSIKFTVNNLGIDVEGQFRAFYGTVLFDPGSLAQSTFQVTIPVKSISTDNRMRDEHLKEEEFFDISRYANIVFKSEQVSKAANGYLVKGVLQMKGKSKQVSIPFTINDGLMVGEFSLDRNDYEIGGSGFLDTIGDEVRIQISCSVKRKE